MGDSVQLQLAGETVELLGERALYRPAHRALLIADLHLGKADVFRRAG
ncbi:phosphoesterase, partial [Xanthomonas oryzae pv. oryzae]